MLMDGLRKVMIAAVAGFLVSCGEEGKESDGAVPEEGPWQVLFPQDGLGEWEVVDFAGHGEVAMSAGALTMEQGVELTGVVWRGEPPAPPYEIELEGRRLLGSDFFCGLTVPVAGEGRSVTLILGGWGGGVVGISSIDGLDASENESTVYRHFADERWYAVRMVVKEERLAVMIDGEELIGVALEGRELGMRAGEISRCAPLGLATWQTAGEFRDLRWRKLPD